MATKLPSRLRRLDDALAALPLEEPMLLTELDGFLSAIAVSPEPIAPGEWLPLLWGGADAEAPFEEPADVQWFTGVVIARHDEILRDLARGKPKPIYDVDERTGEVLWEAWIDGFADAMALRPDAWQAAADAPAPMEDLPALSTLIAVARGDSDLDSIEINALDEVALAAIAVHLLRLHASRPDQAAAAPPASKTGRNDACPCGSGRKFKRCCGRG